MVVCATMSVVMPTILRSAATRCYSLSASLGFSKCGFSPRSSPQQLRPSGTTQLHHLYHNHYRRRSSDHSFGGLRRVTPQEARMSTFRSFATISSELKESAANNPGVCETPDEATKSYFIQQTMYRIKDPKVSLDFYTRILGMTLLKRLDFPEGKFSLYFLGYEDPASIPTDPAERLAYTFSSKATLELTHNWGTESDESFKGHHNGNSDPRGYGHIGITVDDTYKACERFEKLGVKFVKKPDGGSMKGLAFIQDPDGYWIEIFDVLGMKSFFA